MNVKEIHVDRVRFKIWVNPLSEQYCQRKIYRHGIWEPKITKIIMNKLEIGNVFIDAGASVGWFTLLAASIVGKQGKVIAFEPNLDRFKMLIKNVKFNGFTNVLCSEKALSDVKETAFIGGRAIGEVNYSNGVPIRTVDLDSFLSSEGIRQVDLVKMDVEGLDLKMLKGMNKTIRNNSNIMILCEIHPNLLQRHGSSKRELLEYVVKTLNLRTRHITGRCWLFEG